MNKELEQAYFVKKLYIDAAKQLLKDNYEYYYNTTDKDKIQTALDQLKTPGSISRYTGICDNIGCVSDIIIKSLTDFYSDTEDVFCFIDDMTESKAMAVFSPGRNIVIYSINYTDRTNGAINTDSCYYLFQRRKYTPLQYTNMALYYYTRSENIDKEFSL